MSLITSCITAEKCRAEPFSRRYFKLCCSVCGQHFLYENIACTMDELIKNATKSHRDLLFFVVLCLCNDNRTSRTETGMLGRQTIMLPKDQTL